MRSVLKSLWRHRWCRIAGIFGIPFALLMLHPFIRQTVFGPTINDVPWCVWEDEVRRAAKGFPPKDPSWFYQTLEKAGLRVGDVEIYSASAFPVHVHLADDEDVRVRQCALGYLYRRPESELIAIYQRRMRDSDPLCKTYGIAGVWRETRDAGMLADVRPMLDDKDRAVRYVAILLLHDMAEQKVEGVFEPLLKACEDPDGINRSNALYAMHHFGKRAEPVLRKGLSDPDWRCRHHVIGALWQGKLAEGFVPELVEAARNDGNVSVRNQATYYLSRIDPVRFPLPPKKDD